MSSSLKIKVASECGLRTQHGNDSHSAPNDYNYQLADWALVIILCTHFDHYHSVFLFVSLRTYAWSARCTLTTTFTQCEAIQCISFHLHSKNLVSPHRSKFPFLFPFYDLNKHECHSKFMVYFETHSNRILSFAFQNRDAFSGLWSDIPIQWIMKTCQTKCNLQNRLSLTRWIFFDQIQNVRE